MVKTSNSQTGQESPHYKQSSFYRMTYADVIQDFKEKRITIKGLLYYILKTTRKDGNKLRVKDIKTFCKELDISRTAYYKALKSDPSIRFDIVGSMDLWIEDSKVTPISYNVSTKVDTVSQKVDTASQKVDTVSQKVDTASQKVDTDIYKDRVRDRSYSDRTDLTQIAPPEPGAPPPNSVCVSSSSSKKEESPESEKPESTQVSPDASESNSESKPTSSLTTTVSDEIRDSPTERENDSHVQDEHPAAESERWLKPEWAVKRCGSKWIALPEFIKWYAKKSSKPVDYAANCLQKAESESTTQLLWEEYQASLRPSKPLVAVLKVTNKELSPEEEKRVEHERRLKLLRSLASFPEGMRQRRFIPSFLSEPSFTNQIDQSEIPEWVKELMEF